MHRHMLRDSEPAEFRFRGVARDVGVLTASYRRHSFAPHAHDTWTFAAVTRGTMNVHIGGTPDRLDHESIIVIPPGVIHAASPGAAAGWDYVSVYPAAPVIARCVEQLPPGFAGRAPVGVVRSPRLVRLHRDFVERLTHDDAESEAALMRLVEGLWYAAPARAARTVAAAPEIQRAQAFIAANVSRRLSLDEIASVAGMSPFHFIRRFKRAMGTTPYGFFMQLRIERARELLRAGHAIVDVALQCGFVDQSHLNRHFKRIVGVTPGAYAAGLALFRHPPRLHLLPSIV